MRCLSIMDTRIHPEGRTVKLAQWRRSEDMTQEALANELGCTTVTVARYEAGVRLPGPATMIELFVLSSGAVQPNDFYDLPALTVREAA